jgi:hypothetical protein
VADARAKNSAPLGKEATDTKIAANDARINELTSNKEINDAKIQSDYYDVEISKKVEFAKGRFDAMVKM